MKRVIVATLLLLLSCVFFAACGESTSQSATSSSSSSSSTSSGSQQSSTQSSSASTPTSSASAQTVNVLLGEMYVKSNMSDFTVGTPYHFVVKNEGKQLHEFTIASKVPGGNQDSRDAASVKDVDNIQPGQTITFDFTFTKPAPAVGMEFECSYPGHYEMGMHMDITVK